MLELIFCYDFFDFFKKMEQLITLIITPLIISLLTQCVKDKKENRTWFLDHPQAIVALLSLFFGTIFVLWQFAVPSGLKELAISAYPVFAGGAILAYKFFMPIFEKFKK